MSYTPTEWNSGDVITAEKLNKIENGVENSNAVLIVHSISGDGGSTLDKTWKEIHDAYVSGIPCILEYIDEWEDDVSTTYSPCSGIDSQVHSDPQIAGTYGVTFVGSYTTDSENGYPFMSS